MASFWEKIQAGDPAECWPWTGYVTRYGYGSWHPRSGIHVTAHRKAYEDMRGPIPAGLDLDHLCRNRRCCNPAHLEPVTRRENLLRGQTIPARMAERDACLRGHPFTPDNLKKDRGRGRECRACDIERKRRGDVAQKAG